MIRLFLLVLIAVAAAIALDAHWKEESRDLVVHVRTGKEMVGFLRKAAIGLGERALQGLKDEDAETASNTKPTPESDYVPLDSPQPAVASGPPPVAPEPPAVNSGPPPRHDNDDRTALDLLVERKIRENPPDAPTGAD